MNLNKVFIVGNLTKDVELRSTPSGQPVANFTVATNRIYKDASGAKQQEAEFHGIVAWGKLAELCNQYLAKGRLVLVEGRIRTRSWQDQAGVKKYRTEIIAENIQFGPRGTSAAAPTASPEEQVVEEAPPAEDSQLSDIPF